MKYQLKAALVIYLSFLTCGLPAAAVETQSIISEDKESFRAANDYYECEFSRTQPQLLRLAVDSLGHGHFHPGAMREPSEPPRPTTARLMGTTLEYRRSDAPSTATARWSFTPNTNGVTMVSNWSDDDAPEPVVFDFDPHTIHPTVLGRIDADGDIELPAVLHLPGQGSLRIMAPGTDKAKLKYDARRGGKVFVRIAFPPATKQQPRIEYRCEVAEIHPKVTGIEDDPRFDGFRRNWLNILQFNPRLRMLANNSYSDAVAFCFYEHADIAEHTPPLAEGLCALDLVRQSLDRVLAGDLTYGLPGYRFFDQGKATLYTQPSSDTYPSLLIAARAYVRGRDDDAWLKDNYAGIEKWAKNLLATDRDGNGLFEYHLSGNSDSWLDKNAGKAKVSASNWWDTIGFGHEDAYANALAYRALGGMGELAELVGKHDDAEQYRAAAKKLHDAYFKTFYNPDTGVLAGWRSADGELHDYYFLFVNGIAIHYGLVEKEQANAIMDRLLAKMKEVGYTRFDLGLPGNLISVARKDYVRRDLSHGCGQREDNADGFQRYENGGATACFAYFTLAALYDLGRREEADRILFPILASIEKGGFRGRDPMTDQSYDWKAWDGTAWGYEGFLGDNYYVLLALIARESNHQNQ